MFVAGSAALLLWCLAFFPLLNTGKNGARDARTGGYGPGRPDHPLRTGRDHHGHVPVNVRFSGMSLLL